MSDQIGVMEFTYNQGQVRALEELLLLNKRLSRALACAIYEQVFPKGTDPILILELLEAVEDQFRGIPQQRIPESWFS